jgi:type IV pilus assembly protein PilP
LALVVCVTACGYTNEQDLRGFVAAERSALRPVAKAIKAPLPFEAANYEGDTKPDPFNKQAFVQSIVGLAKASKPNLSTPELSRTKEPLEAISLDSMALVGVLSLEGRSVALVRADGKLHQVTPGNYLGQNFGKVIKVEEARVTVREIVQDELGEWSVRSAILKLQEMSK